MNTTHADRDRILIHATPGRARCPPTVSKATLLAISVAMAWTAALVAAPASTRAASPGETMVQAAAKKIQVELSDIAAGHGGFVIDGESEFDQSGYSVAGVGDVNGDGLGDLLVSAPYADMQDAVFVGRSYLVFGRESKQPIALSDVAAGVGGFVINGTSVKDRTGPDGAWPRRATSTGTGWPTCSSRPRGSPAATTMAAAT